MLARSARKSADASGRTSVSARHLGWLGVAGLLLIASAVAVPTSRAGSTCSLGPFGTSALCDALGYSVVVAHSIALRVNSHAIRESSALVDAMTSSPLLIVDLAPGRRLAIWWMEQTGHAVMARMTYL
jgi:hypothetical protein